MKTANIQIDKEGRVSAMQSFGNSQLFVALKPLVRTMPDAGCTNASGCACTVSDGTCG